ncbi:MAG: hypothetical protein F9B45_14850 [Phycisphaera sp. RhM]|nr:hypothetical protein [Phycisphaera sp. RhM]
MMQQTLFDIGLTVCDLFVGRPIETRSAGDRCRAAQLALLTVLLKSRSGTASTDDIVRDSSKAFPGGGKWLGPAVSQLAKDGLIQSCGATRSRRTPRRKGLLSEWEIADREAAKLKVKRLKRGLTFHEKTGSAGASTEPANSQTHTDSKEKTDGQVN